MSQEISAVVCVPTFRRPDMLADTLRSLEAQKTDINFAVIVVDNDAGAMQGRDAATPFFSEGRLRGFVAIEPMQGNCHAINRVFSLAREKYGCAEFFLMIDDDEIADSQWLGQMVASAMSSGADIVGGPVLRRFPTNPPKAIRVHPLFGSIEAPTGFVPAIYGSGNCLIRRRAFEALEDPNFDVRFNTLGGGDMEFFMRCQARGLTTFWNNQAIIVETVPAARSSARWLMKRGLYVGAINYTINRKACRNRRDVVALQVKNILTLPVSLVRGLIYFGKTGQLLSASHFLLMSIGRNLAAFGFAPSPYSASAISAAAPSPAKREKLDGEPGPMRGGAAL